MSTKHTPGPWVVEDQKSHDGSFIVSRPNRKDRTPFTSWWVAFVGPCSDEDETNARLIASAPDLLAALENVSHLPLLLGNYDPINAAYWDKEAETIKAVIRAAKGEG